MRRRRCRSPGAGHHHNRRPGAGRPGRPVRPAGRRRAAAHQLPVRHGCRRRARRRRRRAGRAGERWVAGLYPAPPARRSGCYCATAASRPPPACSPNARTAARTATLTTTACACATAPASASGAARRPAPRSPARQRRAASPHGGRRGRGPVVAALHRQRPGPVPSAQDAWDYWHANGDGEIPIPSEGKPQEAS